MMPAMQSQPHRGRKWRRFLRHQRNVFFTSFLVVLILAAVAALFWVLTSSRFVNVR